jgi:hypothetical protein
MEVLENIEFGGELEKVGGTVKSGRSSSVVKSFSAPNHGRNDGWQSAMGCAWHILPTVRSRTVEDSITDATRYGESV